MKCISIVGTYFVFLQKHYYRINSQTNKLQSRNISKRQEINTVILYMAGQKYSQEQVLFLCRLYRFYTLFNKELS